MSTDWDLISSYAGLLTLAAVSIYAGSIGSLPNPKPKDGAPRDEEDEEAIPERVSSEDAWLFPIIGSVTLGGLFLIIKYFGKEWINWLLGWYFSIAGVGSVWKSSISLVRFCLGDKRWKKFDRFTFSIKKGPTSGADSQRTRLTLSWRTPSLFLFPLALIPSLLYIFLPSTKKNVLLSDILALSFSHNALSLLKLDSFKTGTILLSGLFFYDIWWVFGTRVMVEVATTLDVPIKLLWPKSLVFADTRGFTMLGLGDVVVPGVFIALALRYDHHKFNQPTESGLGFPKPYFFATLTAYVCGLITTMAVMHFWGKAQPALLYLSPACILSFVLTALARGEFTKAWGWSDSPDEKEGQNEAEPKENTETESKGMDGKTE